MKLSVYDWGISSAGRAPALQAGGRRFDPVILHQSSMLVCLQRTLKDVCGAVKQALAIEPVRVIRGYSNCDIGCRSLTIRKK